MGHTVGGQDILKKIAFGLAHCSEDYTFSPEAFVEAVRSWARSLPTYPLLVAGFSGGVDSAVARALLQPVYNERLHAVFVDNGFMRKGEMEEIRAIFGDVGITYRDASVRFYQAMQRIAYPSWNTPAQKCTAEGMYFHQIRKMIGRLFYQVFAEEAQQLGARPGVQSALVQGTNCADWIESITKIKAHHNLEKIARRHAMDIIEPLVGLFKSEIRQIALQLGLPEEVAFRQPFPGPGLALRFSGRFFLEYIAALQEANAILEEEVARQWPDLQDPNRPCQYYVALDPTPTVGLLGDDRVEGFGWRVRMVWSGGGRENYATLDVRPLPAEFQERLESRLVAEVTMGGTRFTRAWYEMTGKPPSTTELH